MEWMGNGEDGGWTGRGTCGATTLDAAAIPKEGVPVVDSSTIWCKGGGGKRETAGRKHKAHRPKK